MDKGKMQYIENEGALFRGPARTIPREVWSPKTGEWSEYKGSAKGEEAR